ncbi:PREDICTED: translation initiation factor IF-2 isoform X2 [Capra hircus]|uniref:translation initiation factor IF-2 isoform X2 n=1 Tax=Capra hircus TaxID=9925 RepID=UPI000847055D|nr:PREDICTED: translation initiation factor IF-2 isoform X2 [Capra hircus]
MCRGGRGRRAACSAGRQAGSSGRVPSCHCDLAERGPDARPCHCSPGSSSLEARLRALFLSCFPFPADRVTAPPPTPPPSSPRELAGGPPAGKVPGGEGWAHERRLTGRLRTQAGRPASLLPPGPWRAPLRPREYLPRGELCLEDEGPLAGLKPRRQAGSGPGACWRRAVRGLTSLAGRAARRHGRAGAAAAGRGRRPEGLRALRAEVRGPAGAQGVHRAALLGQARAPHAVPARALREAGEAPSRPGGFTPPQDPVFFCGSGSQRPPPPPRRLGVVWEVVAVTVVCGVTRSSQLRDHQRCALRSG